MSVGRNGRAWAVLVAASVVLPGCPGATTAPPSPAPIAIVPPAPTPIAPPAPPAITLDEARTLLANGRLDAYESAMRVLTTSSDPVVARRSLAFLGLFFLQQKRIDEARSTLSQAADAYPEVAPFLRPRILA